MNTSHANPSRAASVAAGHVPSRAASVLSRACTLPTSLSGSRACIPQEMSVSSSSEKILCRSCFLRVLFESEALCSDLEVLRERERERARANCCGHRTLMHFACAVGKICEPFDPSTCRCGRFNCRPLAQIAICGMRQLNCGSSSRFRILARMWVKTNRSKTAPMDISNIGCWLTF